MLNIDFAATIGAITGIISILAIAYTLVYRLAKMESRIPPTKEWRQLSERVAKLEDRMATLWRIYVEDELLHRRRGGDLMASSSQWHITEKGEALLPQEVKDMVKGLCLDNSGPEEIAPVIIGKLGIDYLSNVAWEGGIRLQTLIALTYAYCKKLQTG